MIQAICWVLIHSLWQGVLLALAGGGVILCTRRAAPAVRYRVLCGLLGAFLAGIAVTLYYELGMVSGGANNGGGVGISMGWLGEWCSVHAVQVVMVWMLLVVVKSLRMAVGLGYMRRMRREGSPAGAVWAERVERMGRQLGIRRTVKLLESGLVRVPMVIGHLRPIILVPLGLINHLPAGEMEAVLLHELAHIRRLDHVVNMIQQAAECLFFFNPGLLWISALLREERENCCDDEAIAQTGDRVEFVRALVRFKEHSMRGMGLAFPGNKRQLLHRVLRISKLENKSLNNWERSFLLGGCLVLLGLVLAKTNGAAAARQEEAKLRAVEVVDRGQGVLPVSPEVARVMQTRQQVAENMEWVEAQLAQLHRKAGMSGNRAEGMKGNRAEGMAGKRVDGMQAELNREQVERNKEQVERNRQQVERNRQQAERNMRLDEMNRQQAVRDQQQARSREQARSRGMAERSRAQAELSRMQAAIDRERADRDRAQAQQDRERADRDRAEAERGRALADADRAQADADRARAERNRLQSELIRLQEIKVRDQTEKDRLLEEQNRLKADLERIKND